MNAMRVFELFGVVAALLVVWFCIAEIFPPSFVVEDPYQGRWQIQQLMPSGIWLKLYGPFWTESEMESFWQMREHWQIENVCYRKWPIVIELEE